MVLPTVPMTLVTVGFTGLISPTFRNLDLTKAVEEHEGSLYCHYQIQVDHQQKIVGD